MKLENVTIKSDNGETVTLVSGSGNEEYTVFKGDAEFIFNPFTGLSVEISDTHI